MIVKDESEIIISAFNNVRKYIDISIFIISDTGSSDNTISIMKEYFDQHKLKYEIHSDKWINFEHNRNLALDHCSGKSDYIMFFDADDRITGDFVLPEVLTADSYGLNYKSASESGFFHINKTIIKNTVGRWFGVLHESIIILKENPIHINIDGNYFIQVGHFGNRSKNPNKYLDDALMLENAFIKEPENSFFKARYSFYCATSYYSHGDNQKAIEWLKRRLDYKLNSNDFNEDYMTYRYLGMVYKEQGDLASALNTWLIGWNHHPSKAEFLYDASLLSSEQNNFFLAYNIAQWGKKLTLTEIDKNYSYESNIYHYGIDYQISKYGLITGFFDEVYYAIIRISSKPFYSVELVDHIIKSLKQILDNETKINISAKDNLTLVNYLTNNECTLVMLKNELLNYLLQKKLTIE
jgi:tetratricopeptide (TPR) repeat protein